MIACRTGSNQTPALLSRRRGRIAYDGDTVIPHAAAQQRRGGVGSGEGLAHTALAHLVTVLMPAPRYGRRDVGILAVRGRHNQILHYHS